MTLKLFNVFVWFVPTNVGLNKRNGISNKQSLSKWTLNHLLTNTQPFSQIGQMIELGCEYLSVRCIWLYVIIMSRKHFRVNLDPIVGWISKKSKQTRYLKFKWQQRYSNQQPLGKPTLNHLVKLAKQLSCVVSTYLCGTFQISRLLWVRISLIFRQLLSIDSLWNVYVTW